MLLLAACHRQQPVMTDEQLGEIRAAAPGISDDCLRKVQFGGLNAMPPEDQCFAFGPPKRMRGLWRTYFEGSLFCPEPARTCEPSKEGKGPEGYFVNDIWLHVADPIWKARNDAHDFETSLYAVDFIGRRNERPGFFGHMGLSRNEVIVDRMIAAKRMEPSSKE